MIGNNFDSKRHGKENKMDNKPLIILISIIIDGVLAKKVVKVDGQKALQRGRGAGESESSVCDQLVGNMLATNR